MNLSMSRIKNCENFESKFWVFSRQLKQRSIFHCNIFDSKQSLDHEIYSEFFHNRMDGFVWIIVIMKISIRKLMILYTFWINLNSDEMHIKILEMCIYLCCQNQSFGIN